MTRRLANIKAVIFTRSLLIKCADRQQLGGPTSLKSTLALNSLSQSWTLWLLLDRAAFCNPFVVFKGIDQEALCCSIADFLTLDCRQQRAGATTVRDTMVLCCVCQSHIAWLSLARLVMFTTSHVIKFACRRQMGAPTGVKITLALCCLFQTLTAHVTVCLQAPVNWQQLMLFNLYALAANKFCLQAAVGGTNYYEDYTGIVLPLPKLDFMAIPGLGGAVENWGILQFDERRMLVNEVHQGRAAALSRLIYLETATLVDQQCIKSGLQRPV